MNFFKKLFHRHKYTLLAMYPPRHHYSDYKWGFVMHCDCGHHRLTKLPRTIIEVHHMVTPEQYKVYLDNKSE